MDSIQKRTYQYIQKERSALLVKDSRFQEFILSFNNTYAGLKSRNAKMWNIEKGGVEREMSPANIRMSYLGLANQ